MSNTKILAKAELDFTKEPKPINISKTFADEIQISIESDFIINSKFHFVIEFSLVEKDEIVLSNRKTFEIDPINQFGSKINHTLLKPPLEFHFLCNRVSFIKTVKPIKDVVSVDLSVRQWP